MSKGKISAQVAHSVVNYITDYYATKIYSEEFEIFKTWKLNGQKKIILQAPQKLMEELEASGKYHSIRDNGLTEIPPNSLTAICLGVSTREEFYKGVPKLKRLRLL